MYLLMKRRRLRRHSGIVGSRLENRIRLWGSEVKGSAFQELLGSRFGGLGFRARA